MVAVVVLLHAMRPSEKGQTAGEKGGGMSGVAHVGSMRRIPRIKLIKRIGMAVCCQVLTQQPPVAGMRSRSRSRRNRHILPEAGAVAVKISRLQLQK